MAGSSHSTRCLYVVSTPPPASPASRSQPRAAARHTSRRVALRKRHRTHFFAPEQHLVVNIIYPAHPTRKSSCTPSVLFLSPTSSPYLTHPTLLPPSRTSPPLSSQAEVDRVERGARDAAVHHSLASFPPLPSSPLLTPFVSSHPPSRPSPIPPDVAQCATGGSPRLTPLAKDAKEGREEEREPPTVKGGGAPWRWGAFGGEWELPIASLPPRAPHPYTSQLLSRHRALSRKLDFRARPRYALRPPSNLQVYVYLETPKRKEKHNLAFPPFLLRLPFTSLAECASGERKGGDTADKEEQQQQAEATRDANDAADFLRPKSKPRRILSSFTSPFASPSSWFSPAFGVRFSPVIRLAFLRRDVRRVRCTQLSPPSPLHPPHSTRRLSLSLPSPPAVRLAAFHFLGWTRPDQGVNSTSLVRRSSLPSRPHSPHSPAASPPLLPHSPLSPRRFAFLRRDMTQGAAHHQLSLPRRSLFLPWPPHPPGSPHSTLHFDPFLITLSPTSIHTLISREDADDDGWTVPPLAQRQDGARTSRCPGQLPRLDFGTRLWRQVKMKGGVRGPLDRGRLRGQAREASSSVRSHTAWHGVVSPHTSPSNCFDSGR
ncbi:hypothetical protein K438DRAFT_1965328 [Mycena galopus ATCC 62051]|nr:hypothetical protein K438DRAFT_1965328 [Mycena galopus ATCC 62051]